MHGTELTEIATVVVLALLSGLLLTRLRQPAVVGYILAGVLLGPSGLGLVENRENVALLAELGVLMLLFLIGMELSLRAFKRVWRVALLGTALQIGLGLAVMWLLSRLFGWPPGLAVLLGFGVALSSTAVAIKILEDVGELRTDVGRVAIGLLIAQDLAVVPMLLVINGMAGQGGGAVGAATLIGGAIAFLAVLVVLLSRRQSLSLRVARWIAEDADLTAMGGLTFCFAAAAVSGLLGLSPAYGAFLAGLILGNSRERPKMIAATQPIQSVLLMVFFISIGLLLDLGYIWDNLGTVLALLLMVTVVKTAANVGILRLLGEPWPRAYQAGAALGQIGEFSFVLMAAGASVGLVDESGSRLMVAIIGLSLVTSPLWLLTARRLHNVAWRRIDSFRQLWQQIYGRETDAVVAASGRAVSGTVKLTRSIGAHGSGAINRVLSKGEAEEETEADDLAATEAAAVGEAQEIEPDEADETAPAPAAEDEAEPESEPEPDSEAPPLAAAPGREPKES